MDAIDSFRFIFASFLKRLLGFFLAISAVFESVVLVARRFPKSTDVIFREVWVSFLLVFFDKNNTPPFSNKGVV